MKFMEDSERKLILKYFNEGFTFNAIRKKTFPNFPDFSIRKKYISNKKIYTTLGIDHENEHFSPKHEVHVKKKAAEWSNPEKEAKIREMMQDLKKLKVIKETVFPESYISKKHYVDQIILKVLECENLIDFGNLEENLRNEKEEEQRKEYRKKILRYYNEGFTLASIRHKTFGFPEVEDWQLDAQIYAVLGFTYDYHLEFNTRHKMHVKQIAAEWSHPEKSAKIREMMQDLKKLGLIQKTVFPETYISKKHYVDQIILKVLNCENWTDFLELKENIKNQKISDQKNARKDVFSRDSNQCVLSGKTTDLHVHYIDGNQANKALTNLVTLTKEAQSAITNGVNASASERIKQWEAVNANYAYILRTRLEFLKLYVKYLQEAGFPNARIECHSNHGIYSLFAIPSPTENHIEIPEEVKKSYREGFQIKLENREESEEIWVTDENLDEFMEMLTDHGIEKTLVILDKKYRENLEDVHVMNLLADAYQHAQKFPFSYSVVSEIIRIEPENVLAKKILAILNTELEHFNKRNLSILTSILKTKNINRIRVLRCDHNQFQNFAGFPSEMKSLSDLDLSWNHLISFEKFPQSLPNLKKLNLNNNKLSVLPSFGSSVPNLEHLDVSNNQIKFLGDLSSFLKLNHLNLENNKLTSLLGSSLIIHLPHLNYVGNLNFSGNHLENFAGFPVLPIDQIPTDPRASTSFINLQYWGNPIRSFHGIPRYFLYSALSSIRYHNPHRLQSFHFSPRGTVLINQCLAQNNAESPTWNDKYDTLYAYYLRSPTNLATSYAHGSKSLTEEEIDRLKHEGSGTERDYLLLHLPPSDPVVKVITARLTIPLTSGYSIIL
ncbi:MAG: leucine-rich repeat domain-containing protein [Promethearchaeota archaeon]